MKKPLFIASTLLIWIFAVSSLIAVRYLIRKTPEVPASNRRAKALFETLDPDTKRNIAILETSIVRLKDGTVKAIGLGFESDLDDLMTDGRISERKIDFFIEDPVAIERRMMAGEAFKTLNNAEKKIFIDGYGTIIFRNGFYHFIYDEAAYKEYVRRYGTECRTCDEMKKQNETASGGKDGQ